MFFSQFHILSSALRPPQRGERIKAGAKPRKFVWRHTQPCQGDRITLLRPFRALPFLLDFPGLRPGLFSSRPFRPFSPPAFQISNPKTTLHDERLATRHPPPSFPHFHILSSALRPPQRGERIKRRASALEPTLKIPQPCQGDRKTAFRPFRALPFLPDFPGLRPGLFSSRPFRPFSPPAFQISNPKASLHD